MIVVNAPDGGLLVVHQPDHAAMSATIAKRWQRPSCVPPERWPQFIDAVRAHDDGWCEWEEQPALDDAGRPIDFKSVHTREHVTIWRRSIQLGALDDDYVGLLIALHARFLYTKLNNEISPDDQRIAQQFIADVSQWIDECIGRIDDRVALAPANLSAAQKLFTFLDGLSLMMLGAIEWQPQIEQLPVNDEWIDLSLSYKDEEVLLDPWPFDCDAWRVSVLVCRLSQRRFDSSAAYHEQLAAAPPIQQTRLLRPH